MTLFGCFSKTPIEPTGADIYRNYFCGDPWSAEELRNLAKYQQFAVDRGDHAPGLTKATDMYRRCWKRDDA